MWLFRRPAAAEAERLKERGNADRRAGAMAAAEESYRAALRAMPRHIPSLYNLALLLQETGRGLEAEALFGQVLALDPKDTDAALRLGVLLGGRGLLEEAIRVYRQALAVCPAQALHAALAEAHDALGNRLQAAGRLEEAVSQYRAALAADAAHAPAHSNLGCALARMDALDEARRAFERAVELAPDLAVAHANLGSIHSLSGRRAEALQSYERALRLRPGDAAIRENVLFERQNMCVWRGIETLFGEQRRSLHEVPPPPVSPFSVLSIPATRAEQLLCARNFSARLDAAAEAGRFRHEPGERARLRIGYLSADFHSHATAYLTAELFELHDRGALEVIAYSYGPDDGSATRARLERAFDRFVDVRALSYRDAAARINADGVDILVDLKGHTQHARTEIVAQRPAPVQVGFIGYPGTSGAAFIDYLVADRVVTPPEEAADYSEALVLMPASYQVNDRKRPIGRTPSRAELGLSTEQFVLCCFNQSYKITPEVFSVWMRLLHALPHAVLWLLDSNRWARENLRAEASARGVDPQRLVFAPKVALSDHLGRLRAADLFLDTLPYNAHTLASDALWAGLPVLTCAGDTFAGRVAGSLLAAVGLPELIAHSLPEYEALAVRLARNPARLASLRERLAAQLPGAPLFDTPAFAKHLEAAYRQMWRRYCEGRPPAMICPE